MKILIAYYSLYGHMLEMAHAVADGAREVPGTDVRLRRMQEFEAVEKTIDGNDFMRQVRDRQRDIPVCTLDDLREADGMLFGSPTRFGNMTAQMKQLFDSAGSLWQKGELEGKPAGVFTSTGTTHGGQETTLLSMMIPLLHLGAIIVGVPYSYIGMIHTDARGGTPYGASTIAGPTGELKPRPEDLELARLQGRRVAMITTKLRG
jgi:NAD(P)H dehydrogenase (quinone)